MLSSFFFRLLRLMITGIICSLPIYLGYLAEIPDSGILFSSFIAFVVATGFDTYRFSFDFWRIQDYYLGQLLPLVIYTVMGFLTCLLFPPVVFNRIFLPLRFAGCFGMKTSASIVVVSMALILIVTVLRFFRGRAGHSFYNANFKQNEGM